LHHRLLRRTEFENPPEYSRRQNPERMKLRLGSLRLPSSHSQPNSLRLSWTPGVAPNAAPSPEGCCPVKRHQRPVKSTPRLCGPPCRQNVMPIADPAARPSRIVTILGARADRHAHRGENEILARNSLRGPSRLPRKTAAPRRLILPTISVSVAVPLISVGGATGGFTLAGSAHRPEN